MTIEEYRALLKGLKPSDLTAFRAAAGGDVADADKIAAEFAYAIDPIRYERIAVHHLRALGLAVQTEEERSAAIAMETAQAAKQSAAAAERSATHAASSARASWYAVVVSVVAIVVAVLTYKRC